MARLRNLILFAICSFNVMAQEREDAVRVASTYSERAAHIESIGTLYNDTVEVGSGSGLLIGDRYVLTNNHVVPMENNYKSVSLYVRLKTRLARPLQVVQVDRDTEQDLALLTLASSALEAPSQMCPIPVIRTANDAPVGTTIYVLAACRT
jgi:S1-C subfamily serine protease